MQRCVWVRVPSGAPRRSKLYIACSALFYKSERAHAAAPPFQLRPALLGSQLVGRPAGGYFLFLAEISGLTVLCTTLEQGFALEILALKFLPALLGSQLVGRPAGGYFLFLAEISGLTVLCTTLEQGFALEILALKFLETRSNRTELFTIAMCNTSRWIFHPFVFLSAVYPDHILNLQLVLP